MKAAGTFSEVKTKSVFRTINKMRLAELLECWERERFTIWEDSDICKLMWFRKDNDIITEKGCYIICCCKKGGL